ncbi:hypothetical protein R6Q59_036785 [Mikania micrantha]|uniref:Proline-rich protein PRCC n=1 Tax=Mikania micrantha TaxID=192012 RepID=A0A5N6NAT1_9ASTR|nr:hypothetical protein E3N88_21921 [Mikania micrantha]
MDSLLATYASSDEEDDHQQLPVQNQPNQSSKFGGNFFAALPPPKSQPANRSKVSQSDSSPSASLFSKLPLPKSERSDPFSVNPKPKKVVQFRPPVMSKIVDDDDENDDDNKEQTKKDNYIPQAPSVKSFLSSIPAPRNSGSLGAISSTAGTGRRSILEAEVPGLSNSNVDKESVNKSSDNQVIYDSSVVGTVDSLNVNSSVEDYVNHDNSCNEYANMTATSADYASYDYSSYGGYQNIETDHSTFGPTVPTNVDHVNYSGYQGYNEYENYGQHENKWIDQSTGNLEPAIPVARPHGKRGRNEIPEEVIEVNQDELMKNRPREDQAKLTGIAFGPSYQPASSTKGKPSKLHKRKHQIGSLYYDMRSKEAELSERRSRGMLTKAETHAKYGW